MEKRVFIGVGLAAALAAAGLLMGLAASGGTSAFETRTQSAGLAGGSPAAAFVQPDEELEEGGLWIAGLIGAEFGVGRDQVVDLHNEGIGLGALFKVYQIAKAKGMRASDLVATLPLVDGKRQPDFDALVASLTPEQQANLTSEGPRNLGQLVSANPPGRRNR